MPMPSADPHAEVAVDSTSSAVQKEQGPDSRHDPLLECLVQLSKMYRRTVSRISLTAGLPLAQNRLTVSLFSRSADRAGMASRVLKKRLDAISPLHLPAILLLTDNSACLLVGKSAGGDYTILVPETGMGEASISAAELEKLYTGYAIFVRPKFRPRQPVIHPISRKNWFWGTLFESWRIYRDVFIASFLINLFGLASPFFVLIVYDRVIPNLAFETLWVLAVGILLIFLFSLLLRGLRGYFVDEAGKKANLKMSSIIFQKVFGLRMEARPRSIGSFSKNLQEFESVLDFITSFTITTLIDMPFVVFSLFVMWYFGGNIVWILLIFILLLMVYAFFIQLPLQNAVEKTYTASAQKNAVLVEGLAGFETIKLMGAESQLQRSWEESVGFIARWSAKSRLLASSVSHIAFFLQSASIIIVVIAGVYKIAEGDLTQGGLIALVLLSRQAIAPMAQVVNLSTRYHRARSAYKTLNEIMEMPEDRPEGKNFLHRSRFEGSIEAKNVSFSYPGQTTTVLNNISLNISAGEKVGIIGPVGSGKTTLGKLALGLFDPTNGMVSIDGTDIRQIDPAELRKAIGYVPQDITLFRGTVRYNITIGSPDIDDEALVKAIEISGVGDFTRKHPSGIDMEVAELGGGLSGGQRQCITLARALLSDPPILILDEPTSNMDNRTESRIKANLSGILNEKTLLLITHRASLLEMVNRIIIIDSGAIVADGPKASVLEALRKGHLNL
ncbi:MAG: type I secretion system permease/ATPase [Desulfobacterales bacterium]